jgi:hypothetical protein
MKKKERKKERKIAYFYWLGDKTTTNYNSIRLATFSSSTLKKIKRVTLLGVA